MQAPGRQAASPHAGGGLGQEPRGSFCPSPAPLHPEPLWLAGELLCAAEEGAEGDASFQPLNISGACQLRREA